MSHLTGLAGVTLSAALFAAAFPPLTLWWLAWAALAPWLLALSRSGVIAGAVLGLCWSLLVGAGTAFFVPEMIASYFGASAPLAWLAAIAAVAVTGSAYALFAGVLAWRLRSGPVGPLFVAGLFGLCELARTHVLPPNPWAMTGYAQLPYSTIAQLADVAGVGGIGMLVAGTNALICGLFAKPFRPHSFRWEAVVMLCCLIAANVYGTLRLGEDFEGGDSVTVALVQDALPRSLRQNPEHHSAILNHQRDLTLSVQGRDVDLVLWPEYALEFELREGSAEWRALGEVSQQLDADLLVGTLTRANPQQQGLHNSAVLLRGDIRVDTYHKGWLMPFGETDDGGDWLRGSEYALLPGTSRAPLPSSTGDLGVLLCNEVMLPGPARESVLEGAQILANPSNDDWFSRRGAQLQLQVAAFRAIENRRALVRPTHSGITALVDAHGLIHSLPVDLPGVLVQEISPRSTLSVYSVWGDIAPFAVACVALVTSQSWLSRSRRRA